jgi:hypothetical protein
LGKILEKIITTRLTYYVEKYELLHNEQMGGRKQRSAIDAAMCLTHDIQKARNKGLKTTVLMLDIKGAFDNVWKPRLLEMMQSMGISKNII